MKIPTKNKSKLVNNQQIIYQYILKYPGSHLRKISRELDINLSTLRHHLSKLEKNEIIISSREANLKVYFVKGKVDIRDKKYTYILQQKRFRDVISILILYPEFKHKDIANYLSLNPSTLSKYLKILAEREIIYIKIENNRKIFTINNEKRVLEILRSYKKSFLDNLVDRILQIYFE